MNQRTSTAEAVSSVDDHRKRVARERRDRMKKRLLRSVLEVVPEHEGTAQAVIDDIIKHADVSRGTFYKYFSSLDEAVMHVTASYNDDMQAAGVKIYHQIEKPQLRVACGFQLHLLRSLMDPRWGAFLSRIAYLGDNGAMINLIEGDIILGIKEKCFTIDDIEVAVDVLLGAKSRSILKIVSGKVDVQYIHKVTISVLYSFGMDRASARKSTHDAYNLMVRDGPDLLPWWRSDIVASWN
jgi:AcrR family transcriptional regulator